MPLWPVVKALIRYIGPDKACGCLRRGPVWKSYLDAFTDEDVSIKSDTK